MDFENVSVSAEDFVIVFVIKHSCMRTRSSWPFPALFVGVFLVFFLCFGDIRINNTIFDFGWQFLFLPGNGYDSMGGHVGMDKHTEG